MAADNVDDLVGALHRRARRAATETRDADFKAWAVEAAFALSSEQRAWARIRLAADLRAEGEIDAALRVLTLRGCSARLTRRSARSSRSRSRLIAIGAHVIAEVIEREEADRMTDLKFARAAARLYSELARQTEDDSHRRLRDHYASAIRELEQSDSAVAA